MAEIARQLGVCTSVNAKAIRKGENIWNHRGRREILCVLKKINERQRGLGDRLVG